MFSKYSINFLAHNIDFKYDLVLNSQPWESTFRRRGKGMCSPRGSRSVRPPHNLDTILTIKQKSLSPMNRRKALLLFPGWSHETRYKSSFSSLQKKLQNHQAGSRSWDPRKMAIN